jgi:N-methylhydantoinase A
VPGALDADGIDALVARFEAAYERRYGPGSGYRDAGVELVTCRVRGTVERPRPSTAPLPRGAPAAPADERQVYHLEAGRFLPTLIYAGQGLAPGARLPGPAIIQYAGTTVVIPPGWTGEVDPYLNVWILRDPQ